jgi:MFS transporter, PAT family, beta-lactamase induction signal transducer AmpG
MTARHKLLLLGALYLSQGVPYGFFSQALPVLLRNQGLSLPLLGLTNLLALPWALKFLWAPALDRRRGRGGRRRGAIVPLQLAAAGVLGLMALAPPAASLGALFAGVLLVNALSATQDVATDGLAVELLTPGERGLGNGVQVAGYRVGMVLGGGLIVLLFSRLGWTASLLLLALAMLVATIPIARFHEPPAPPPARPPSFRDAAGAWLGAPAGRRVLGLLLVFKVGEALATAMLRPFLVDAGLSLADVGLLLGVVGFGAGLLGAMTGGALYGRLGRARSLGLFGLLQALSVALYALVALAAQASPAPLLALGAACAAEHFAAGMATAALFTAMMDACRPGHEATDYTVQACAVVVSTGAAAAVSGVLAQRLGYPAHFALAACLCLAGAAVAALPGAVPRLPWQGPLAPVVGPWPPRRSGG